MSNAQTLWRQRNPEKNRELQRQYREQNPEKCRRAVTNSQLKKKYGITLDQWEQMLEDQDGQCGCCGVHQMYLDERLCVDHDHETGKVRELVCRNCNLALGHLDHKVIFARCAVRYLKRWEAA